MSDEATAVVMFGSIAAITFTFSFFPRSFVRVFVPRTERQHAVRHIVRDPNFSRRMRVMAGLQFTAGLIIAGAIRLFRG